MHKHIDYPSSCGKAVIEAFHWPCENPRGVVQLCHGMAEHVERYDEFARFLNDNGFAVVGNNHLGHGASLIDGQLGYFGDDGAYNNVVEDMELLRKRATALYPNVPYFVFGHSMGSFLTRIYIARYGNNITGAVICGTMGPNRTSEKAQLPTKAIIALKGPKYVSQVLADASSVNNLKRIPNARTKFDWLSRDESVVDAYINDDLCGFTFTCSAYLELSRMIENISDDAWFMSVPKALPLYVISGEEDPVGNWGEGVKLVYQKLLDAGVKDVTMKLYPGARHEPLNELNRTEVFNDVLNFLQKHI